MSQLLQFVCLEIFFIYLHVFVAGLEQGGNERKSQATVAFAVDGGSFRVSNADEDSMKKVLRIMSTLKSRARTVSSHEDGEEEMALVSYGNSEF